MNQRWFLSVVVLLAAATICLAWACPKCMKENPDEGSFCDHCGQKRGTKPLPAGGGEPGDETKSPKPGDASEKTLDERIDEAVAKGVQYLWNQQKSDGRWEPFSQDVLVRGKIVRGYFKHPAGNSAIAAYALLESGVSSHEERMAKALDWLGRQSITKTYTLGLRANVWRAANRTTKGKYKARLAKDARQLGNSTKNGAYGHNSFGRPDRTATVDHWNSQYAVLGIWAAHRDNVEVPVKYWQMVMRHWEQTQGPDGGWPYKPKSTDLHQRGSHGTMTAGGVASLFVCFDMLHAGKFITCGGKIDYKPIARGLEWFDKWFEKTIGTVAYDYLYGVERVGLASGHKYFGTINWFETGARMLLEHQDDTGRWGNDVSETAFALLFLARGRHPVAFSKLKFDGDWNNRPRALAFLTRWMGDSLKRDLSWQIVDFGMDLSDWLDAPILCISGEKKPTFSEQELARLREYVSKGGSIFSIAECSGKEFSEGMRAVYAKLFPDYKLVPAEETHAIYTNPFPLRGSPQFSIVSDGLFPLAIHCDQDLVKGWLLQRSPTSKPALQAATNVLMYVTNGKLRNRGTGGQPSDPQRSVE